MDKKLLKQNYEKACNDYLRAFCEKHDFLTSYWICDHIGGVADCGNFYSVGIDDIRTDIDDDAPTIEFERWYEYCIKVSEFNLNSPNFKQWLDGCPRTNEATLQRLRKMREEFENVVKDEKERIYQKK